MNSPPLFGRLLWAAIGLTWMVAIVVSVRTFSDLGTYRSRMVRKAGEITELLRMQKELRRYREARLFFESLPVKRPEPVERRLQKAGLEAKVCEVANPPSCAVKGWRIRRQDVDFGEGDVPIAPVMAWLRETENAATTSPPWRVIHVSVRASPRTAGTGRVVALLEALERYE